MDKKNSLIEKLLLTLKEEKELVNKALIDKNQAEIIEYQRRAFLTGKALRKIL